MILLALFLGTLGRSHYYYMKTNLDISYVQHKNSLEEGPNPHHMYSWYTKSHMTQENPPFHQDIHRLHLHYAQGPAIFHFYILTEICTHLCQIHYLAPAIGLLGRVLAPKEENRFWFLHGTVPL